MGYFFLTSQKLKLQNSTDKIFSNKNDWYIEIESDEYKDTFLRSVIIGTSIKWIKYKNDKFIKNIIKILYN